MTPSVPAIRDWRSRQKAGGPDPKCGLLGWRGRLVMRAPKDVTGITIHQTACVLSAGRRLDRHERALEVHAHATVFSDGVGVIAYPLRSYVYHGNGANASRIGLEIEGAFKGTCGDFFRAPDIQIDGARETLRWLVEQARAEGCPIQHIDAHRQWSGDRQGDPGEELWRRVVLEYAIPVLGLKCDRAFYDPRTQPRGKPPKKPGRPIPKAWDPDGIGPY